MSPVLRCAFVLAVSLVANAPSAFAASGPAPDIIAEMNRVRADPLSLARALDRLRQGFSGRIVREPGEPVDRMTVEGVAALDEAIRFLRRQAPVAPLAASTALTLSASDHVRDQGPDGAQGHVERDGSTPLDRVLRHGLRPYVVGEVIAYGPRTAEQVVRELVIDDGVADRGHRLAIFSSEYARAGAACGPHRRYRIMCVVDFAGTADAPSNARWLR